MSNDKKYAGDIVDSLIPTFENVIRLFTTETIPDILLNDKKISFNLVFNESDAIKHIEEVYEKYIAETYSGFQTQATTIIEILKQKNNVNNDLPSLVINDYRLFFELLREYYEKIIELFFVRTKASGFMVSEMKNCFEQIWLRATPEDFNNSEQFLRRQVEFINNTTFAKYDNEAIVGSLRFLDSHILAVKNEIARTWDETPQEFKIIIYDKEHYQNRKLFERPHFTLPVIRYGIYEKNGKKICHIGSVQTKKNMLYKLLTDKVPTDEIKKLFNRLRYKINKGMTDEGILETEPSHIIALNTFISFLHNEGITEIEAPSLHELDYQFHEKQNIIMVDNFQKEWTEYKQNKFPERYLEEKAKLEKALNKEDIISRNKSQRFISNLVRIMHHYPKSEIKTYPGDYDSLLRINIPPPQTVLDIDNDILQEIYLLVDETYKENKFIYGHGEVVGKDEFLGNNNSRAF